MVLHIFIIIISLAIGFVLLVLALGEETAVLAVVGSIVWAFRRLKKPRFGELSARGSRFVAYVPNFPFFYQ